MEWCAEKVVIITGGSAGIGAATAREFAKRKAHLLITGRNEERLRQVAQECIALGTPKDKMVTCNVDLEKEDDVKKVYRIATEKFSRIDVLVNNAGYINSGTSETYPVTGLDAMYNLFVRGVYLLCQLSFPKLKESRGCIVNVSSVLSWKVFVGNTDQSFASYHMMKAAQDALTRQLSVEWAKYGIRVNTVNPALTKTNIHVASGRVTEEKREQYYQANGKLYPLGRCAEAEEVARPIVFLASPEASFVNGQCLAVDGAVNHVYNAKL